MRRLHRSTGADASDGASSRWHEHGRAARRLTMNDSRSFSQGNARCSARRHARSMRAAALAFACAVLLAAGPLYAQCTIDAQGADDEPGQRDISQTCLAGTCSGSDLPITWSLDDTKWSGGGNTGDA